MLKIDFFFCFMCLIIYQASWYFVTVKVDAKNMVWLFRHEIIKLVFLLVCYSYSYLSDESHLDLLDIHFSKNTILYIVANHIDRSSFSQIWLVPSLPDWKNERSSFSQIWLVPSLPDCMSMQSDQWRIKKRLNMIGLNLRKGQTVRTKNERWSFSQIWLVPSLPDCMMHVLHRLSDQ